MRSTQFRRACLSFLPLLLGSTALSAQPRVTVGRNVQVSIALPSDPHFEMMLAADPTNPDRLMACSVLWPNDYHTSEVITYVSLDRGKTWAPTLRTRGDRGYPSWDPACTYGPDGTLYSVSENIDTAYKSFDRIDRSVDGGRTWLPNATRIKHGERTFVSIDHTNGPRRGWMYLYGSGGTCLTGVTCPNSSAIFLRASGDGGRTIATEQQVPATNYNYMIGIGQGVVLADGTLLAPIGEWLGGDNKTVSPPPRFDIGNDNTRPNGVMRVIRSRAERPNWTATTEVVQVSDWFYERLPNGSYLPHMAVDASNGPFKGRVYITWPDQRSGRYEVYLSYSDDAGKTWSAARRLNDDYRWHDGTGPHAIQGMVAVNKDGVVGVSWFDRREHRDNLGWTVRFRASLDGGETFSPSVPVSEKAFDPSRIDPMPLFEVGAWSRGPETLNLSVHSFNFSGGHTVGMTADAGGIFHVLWVGSSTSTAQLWTAPVTVVGVAQKNGAPELSTLVDASKSVRFLMINRRFSRKTGIAEADLILDNISKDTIRGPLKIRLLDLSSESGVAQVMTPDSGPVGEGAVWDLTSAIDGGVLLPDQQTRPKRLRFAISNLPPTIRPVLEGWGAHLATFNLKVLAGSVGRAVASAGKK